MLRVSIKWPQADLEDRVVRRIADKTNVGLEAVLYKKAHFLCLREHLAVVEENNPDLARLKAEVAKVCGSTPEVFVKDDLDGREGFIPLESHLAKQRRLERLASEPSPIPTNKDLN